jgi:hypothetical protein
MTLKNFQEKYNSFISGDDVNEIAIDVLMLVNSNLSDVQHMGVSEDANKRLNSVKELASDLRSLLKSRKI